MSKQGKTEMSAQRVGGEPNFGHVIKELSLMTADVSPELFFPTAGLVPDSSQFV